MRALSAVAGLLVLGFVQKVQKDSLCRDRNCIAYS